MPWLRHRRDRLVLLHSRREGARVAQVRLGSFGSVCELTPEVRSRIEAGHPEIGFDWQAILSDALAKAPPSNYRILVSATIPWADPKEPALNLAKGRVVIGRHAATIAALIIAGARLEPVPVL